MWVFRNPLFLFKFVQKTGNFPGNIAEYLKKQNLPKLLQSPKQIMNIPITTFEISETIEKTK